jgi:hypothetical protein
MSRGRGGAMSIRHARDAEGSAAVSSAHIDPRGGPNEDRIVGHLRAPLFDLWACAGIHEILPALHGRLVVGG